MNCNSLLQYWQSNGYVWKHVIFMCYYEYMLFGNRKMYLKKTNKREHGIFDEKQRVLLLHPCFFFHPFDWSLMDEVWQAILYDKKQVRENNIFISCFMVNNKGKKDNENINIYFFLIYAKSYIWCLLSLMAWKDSWLTQIVILRRVVAACRIVSLSWSLTIFWQWTVWRWWVCKQ